MIGYGNTPSLLVSVADDYNPTNFKFRVVNGAWEGEFINGNISIFGPPGGDYTSLDKAEIICDNQDRLRSIPHYDYQTVFNNFGNPDYVAPKPTKYIDMSDLDDDIPF